MPTQYLYCDGISYVLGGGATVGASRDNLIYGTYVPGLTPDTVGTTSTPTTITAVTNTTQSIPASTTLVENTRFRSSVSLAAGTSPITFRNCHFVGNNPQDSYASRQDAGVADIPGYGFVNFTGRHATFIDCTFDNGWWFDQGLSNRYSINSSFGIWGGNFTLIRCEMRRFTDLVNFAGRPNGDNGHVLIEASWMHENYFATSSQEGGITHSDTFQFNTGHSVEIRNSYLGGNYTQQTSTQATALGYITPGANNAVILIQQENDPESDNSTPRTTWNWTPNWYVEDIYIHDNWFHGAAATINLNCVVPSNTDLFNPLAGTATDGVRIVRNKFAVRNTTNKSGFQIRKTTSVTSYLADNVEWDPAGSINGNGTVLTTGNGRIVTEADE